MLQSASSLWAKDKLVEGKRLRVLTTSLDRYWNRLSMEVRERQFELKMVESMKDGKRQREGKKRRKGGVLEILNQVEMSEHKIQLEGSDCTAVDMSMTRQSPEVSLVRSRGSG